MCGVTRLLVIGFLIGTVVSSLTGSDLAGWVAALLATAALAGVQRVRGGPACPVPATARVGATARRET